MIEVIATDEFKEWYLSLNDQDAEAVEFVVGLLERQGVMLGYPYSSQLFDSKAALRELRAQSGGRPIRISYAFDPKRQAVLLVGGDKTGDDNFYRWFISESDKIWAQYLLESSSSKGKGK